MPDGFKLLDAYVEVTASGKGLAEKVGKDFESEAPAAAKRSSASFGSSLLSGFRSMPSVGGSVAQKVGEDFEKAAPAAANRSSSSFGSSLLGGMKGLGSVGSAGASLFGSAFTGVIGGLVGGVTSTVLSMVGSVVSGATSMAAQLTSIVASTVIDFNSTLQNATIGFTTMLGSGTKSAEFLNKLQDFAKSTPFEFKNLIANAQNMMGMGIAAKDVIPDLTALGDSVASIGGNAAQVDQVTLAFDQMAAKGTLDMGNMNQLMQGGVPSALKILASAYKTTTGDMIGMISTGKVQANVALPALIKGLEQGTKSTAALGGMMAKQSFTFTGALSNIQDGLTQTVSKAFKPFFDVASKGMQRFATSLSGKPAEKFQKEVTTAIQPLAKNISKWFNGIDFDKIFANAGNMVKDFGKTLKSKEFSDFVGKMKDVAKSVADTMPAIGKAIKSLGPGVVDTVKEIADMIKWVADTMTWFEKLEKSVDKVRDNFAHNWSTIGSDLTGALKSMQGATEKWSGDVTKTFNTTVKNIKGFFDDANQWLVDAGANIISGLVSGIQSKISAVTDVIGSVANTVKDVFTGPSGIDSHSPSKVFEKYGTWVIQGLKKGLLGSIDQIKQASTDLSNAVRSAFSTTNMTSSQEKGALGQIKAVTKELVATAKDRDKAVTALSAAKDKLSGLKSDKASYGAGVATSARSGFDVGTIYSNGASAMDTYTSAKADYTSAMSDYQKGLADAQRQDSLSSKSAMSGSLDGKSYMASYTTQGGGTAVADYLANTAKPVDQSGTKPLTGIALVKSNLKKILTDTKAFTSNLKKLVSMGLDKITLQQLIDAGPTAGLDITKDMIADPAGLKSIVSLQKQITTADNSLGGYVAGQFYDKQIASAQKVVNHDQRAVNQFNVTMTIDAEKLNDVQKMMDALNALSKTAKAAKAKK